MANGSLIEQARSKLARPRALSLDSLRGFAILAMVLTGMVPYFHHTLPAWMYHAQMPPPEHSFRPDIYGITWVDVVFPLFLFSLGAAIPLALWQKLHTGASRWGLAWSACWRGALLLFFAVFKQNVVAGNLLQVYGSFGNAISIGGFALMFLIFTRYPDRWPGWVKVSLRIIGWVAALALLSVLDYPDGGHASVHKHDPIISILANVVVTTSFVWLLWPSRITGRILIMIGIIVFHLARRFTTWGVPLTELHALRDLAGERIYNGLFWAINPTYQKYLLISIPGMIAGDILLLWLRPASERLSFRIRHSRWRELGMMQCVCLAIVCLAIVICTVVGFSLNDWQTTAGVAVGLCAVGLLLLFGAPARRRLRTSAVLRGQSRIPALTFQRLFLWGVMWLLIGLALVPYQGGIQKDPATLSFLFTTAGLSSMLLIFFAVITEAMHRPGPLFLLIANGQNPMIAYVAASMFLMPLLDLIPAGGGVSVLDWLLTQWTAPWPVFGRAVAFTLTVGIFVWGVTRVRVFWRT